MFVNEIWGDLLVIIRLINDIILKGPCLARPLPPANPLPGKGNKHSTQLARLVQYFAKYLGSIYQIKLDAQPHLYN
jgi:hypothetical protein